ncbi:MAG: PH domain-containing protein [Verrucomicrobiota bacterium]
MPERFKVTGEKEENLAPGETPAFYALPHHLKPRKGSFVFPRVVSGLLAFGVIGAMTAGLLLSFEKAPWPGLAVFVAGAVLSVIGSLVAYRKENYELHESRVICHRGGLVSDETTELEIRNITHVKLKLPWLRHKFYGVGDVIVETAGNSRPVIMRVIREPEAFYAGLRERMKRNGYDLTQQQLLHEEQPALIGILGQCLGYVGFALGALTFSSALFTGTSEFADAGEATDPAVVAFAALGLAGVAGIALVAGAIRFFDFRRRTYRVFNDVVVYEEGFLTRHNAFIPYENIADANTKCTFFDRIFGLYDVEVSCQGSGKEIKFRRLLHGVALSAAIDQLVVFARAKQPPTSRPTAGATVHTSQIRPRGGGPPAIPVGECMVADLRMHAGRTLVPLLLLLPLVPIWIAAMIRAGIRLISTRYSVRPGSVRHAYRFLTLSDREFAYDKITGVVIKQNFWDRMFGTMTLKFWSIGAGQPLEFTHVHGSLFDLTALLRQAGIPAASTEPYAAETCFGMFTWLGAHLKSLALLLLFATGIVIAAIQVDRAFYYLLAAPLVTVLGCYLYAKLYYARQQLWFHGHHVEAEQGIIARRRYYARYSNIKRTTVTRYPGGKEGKLEIFVAGEETGQSNAQNKKQLAIHKPYSFATGFLPQVCDQGLLLDDILCGRIEPSPQAVAAEPLEVLLKAPRAVGNAVVKLVLLSILLPPLIVLLPLTLPLTVMRVKRWRYRITAAQIVLSRGILYRSETSVLLDRVDSLQQSQGPLNKIFSNGNVTIMTAGSSKPEVTLVDSPAYLELYRIIREHSK